MHECRTVPEDYKRLIIVPIYKVMDSKDFFKAAYLVLINKERGPRLASLIISIGRYKAIDLLKQIG